MAWTRSPRRADQSGRTKGGSLHAFDLTPEAAGLSRATPAALKGGEPAHNAKALTDVLGGADGAYRDIALINAGGGAVIAGKAGSIKEGVAMGDAAIRSGAARRRRPIRLVSNDEKSDADDRQPEKDRKL